MQSDVGVYARYSIPKKSPTNSQGVHSACAVGTDATHRSPDNPGGTAAGIPALPAAARRGYSGASGD